MRSYKIKNDRDGTGHYDKEINTLKQSLIILKKDEPNFVLFSPSASKCILS